MENKNILIVEDDPAMVKLFELSAKKYGLNIISASNGAEGLKKLSLQDFILVITDLKMPIMNGIELINHARKIPKYMNFPFVIVTGNLKEFSADLTILGNLTLMEKPLKQVDFQELLENTLKISSGEIGPTIPDEELTSFLSEKLKKISALMLEIITKTKPEIKVLQKIPNGTFFEGQFFSTHLIVFQNCKIGVVFNFDKDISEMISSEIVKGSNLTPEVILESLGKVTISMMKKIPENSPYANSFPPSIPISLNGGQNKSILGTLNNNFLTNIHSKTGKGNLIIHLLKF